MNQIKALLLTLLIAVLAVTATACAKSESDAPAQTGATTTNSEDSKTDAPTQTEASITNSEDSKSDAPAQTEAAKTYSEDAEIGKGAAAIKVKVITDQKTLTLTIHTDKDNLEDALLEYGLIEGDESEYGLYIKKVNGIEADYDKDKSWWAISKDGEALMTGAKSTVIADGENYEFTYTKG